MRLYVLLILLLALTGCCRDDYRFDGELDIRVVECTPGETLLNGVTDTIRGPFFYQATLNYVQLAAAPVVRPAQLLFAFSCAETYDRTLTAGSVRVTVDRSLVFDGQPYPAGGDLIELLERMPDGARRHSIHGQGVTLHIEEDFLARARLPAATYTFTFEGVLDDGTPVAQSTAVYLDL